MKYNKTLALIPAMLLAACGGEEQTMNEPATPGSVVYSYPADGQSGISPKASIVVRFSHAISDEEADLQQKILVTDGTTPVTFTVTKVDGGRSLKLTPSSELATGTEYSVTFTDPLLAAGAREVSTPNAQGPEGIQFSTRGGFTGIAGLDNLSGEFAVAELIPSPDNQFKPMNFSTFRLTLTHPVHPEWREMGGQITLENAAGETVPATVLVDQRRITVDPCTVESKELCGSKDDALTAGETYTLRIQGLPSHTSAGVLDFTQEFTPRETGPTVVLFQEVIDSGLLAGSDESAAQTSLLNGQIINGVTLNSVLQGVAGPSQQTGGLFAELAYAPSFSADEPLPLRVPKGSVLTSSSLDVKINGSVPVLDASTGQLQTTGDINVTMLSDATGYLSPNPYTDDLSAPRHVKLFMDVAMNTEAAQPNASLSQDLLGVELSGIALVKDGVLTIDAIGVVEPELLGQEYTDSTIAFRIEAATDADSVLDAAQLRTLDTTSPQLVSWMPGPADAIPATRQSMQRPGDPVILNFDEPLDPETVASGITVIEGATALPNEDVETKLDGTVVVINPKGGLKHGVGYSVQIDSSLTDLAGNGATAQSIEFSLPALSDGTEADPASPIALTTYPGFPCVTTAVDLNARTHGQCVDDAPNGPEGDVLPVTTLPADRPIVVVFSQSMDLASIRSGETFVVEKVAADGTYLSDVSGRLETNNQRIRFYPDQPWEQGSFYRYTLASGTVVNDCANAVCSEAGYPLQTDLLVNPEDVGGPDLTIYFEGAEERQSVFTPLRNLPIRDVNSNYVIDCPTLGGTDCLEPFNHDVHETDGFKPSANAAKLAVTDKTATVLGAPAGASVGCSADETCPESKFIYQTYGLNTEVVGPAVDEETGKQGVRVLLYPTMLATTSATVVLDTLGEQVTGPQILRMRYGKDDPACNDSCARSGLIPGIIVEGENGGPVFKTTAELTLDAPNLVVPLEGALQHNLYAYPFTLELDGDITFFDDGRMQIEQRNSNVPEINVLVSTEDAITGALIDFGSCLGGLLFGDTTACEALLSEDTESTGAVLIPLVIPDQGLYLNFISNPIKEIPAQQ
ncbi:Ig-like domain-containing protein [Marinobacter arenosus]|uniref:Ig-like domain-containing protein n=1 Tax=Marinobacter arenosus TaxID=2856822 RepID=UPI001C4AE9F0|nr:Ig-like domain-containing protein [Marinobacter arenosus]MBW0148656.1 Ig-like domain-containing protein [Marinobacter arenosus]